MTDFSPITISSFKAYDIRGELGKNLDEDIAYRIGRAFAQFLSEPLSNQQKLFSIDRQLPRKNVRCW